MAALMFTRHDYNNLLNYSELRSIECLVSVDGSPVDPEQYTRHFTSNTDMIPDYVSARKLRDVIQGKTSYLIRIRKPYPFHEAFIEDAVELSLRHLQVYTPVAVAASNAVCEFEAHLDHPHYLRAYEGGLADKYGRDLVRLDEPELSVADREVVVVYRPNVVAQRELLIRMFRKKVRGREKANDHASSIRGQEAFMATVEEIINDNIVAKADRQLFRETLLQYWPCGARRRLATFIYLTENRSDVVAERVPWNAVEHESGVIGVDGKLVNLARSTKEDVFSPKNLRLRPRTEELDSLALMGVIGYRPADYWRFGGWPLMASNLDPLVVVRTDGELVWMCQAHGGLESVYRNSDGRNLAIGSGYIEQHLSDLFTNREVLFVGLGLGVLQRGLDAEGRGLTIEKSDGVVELFLRLWPSSRQKIQVGDFYELLPTLKRTFDTVLIDHFDPEFRSIDPANLRLILNRLRPFGQLVINRQGQREEFIRRAEDCAQALGLQCRNFLLPNDQTVLQISPRVA